jgi:hypothetical protein
VETRTKPFRAFAAAIARWTLATAVASAAALSGQQQGSAAKELEVKGAFVLNFIRFVSWSQVPGENEGDLPVCALANSEFAHAVRRAVTNREIQGRVISFRFDSAPRPARCRVLIVDTSEYRIAGPALEAVAEAPVLTIGNGAGLLDLGGMFELVMEDHKIRFNTNLEAVRRAPLRVSANLLQLSRNLALRTANRSSR